jgi:hypothetical protein
LEGFPIKRDRESLDHSFEKFEVFMVVIAKITVYWDEMPCNVMEVTEILKESTAYPSGSKSKSNKQHSLVLRLEGAHSSKPSVNLN